MTTVYYKDGILTSDTKISDQSNMDREKATQITQRFLESTKDLRAATVLRRYEEDEKRDTRSRNYVRKNGKVITLKGNHYWRDEKILAVGFAGILNAAYYGIEYFDENPSKEGLVQDLTGFNYTLVTEIGPFAACEYLFVTERSAFIIGPDGHAYRIRKDDGAIIIGSGRMTIQERTLEEERAVFKTCDGTDIFWTWKDDEEIRRLAELDPATNGDWKKIVFH